MNNKIFSISKKEWLEGSGHIFTKEEIEKANKSETGYLGVWHGCKCYVTKKINKIKGEIE